MLSEFRVKPLAKFLSRNRAEVRHQRVQFPQGRGRALLFAELPIDSSQVHVRPTVGGHVDLQSDCQCAVIVMLAVGVAEGYIVVPARMMWVELHRSFHYAQAVFPVTGISDHVSEYCRGGGIHAIQGEGALRCWAEGQVIFLEEQRGSQCAVCEVAGRRRCDCSLRGSTSAAYWIRLQVVTERVLVPVDHRQFGEAITVVGGAGDRSFEYVADFRVLLRGHALPVAERAEHSLMRGVLTGAPAPEQLTHAMDQRAILIR